MAFYWDGDKCTGYVGTHDEWTGYNGTWCTDWVWNNKLALSQKQMSPKAESRIINVSADEVIRRHFVEIAHCEWIIDQFWLLIEMGSCECRAPSCVTIEITTSAVRGRAVGILFTACIHVPGGVVQTETAGQWSKLNLRWMLRSLGDSLSFNRELT